MNIDELTDINSALEMYKTKFHEPYPLCVVDDRSDDEIIEDIKHCIKTNSKAPEPEYDPKCDY